MKRAFINLLIKVLAKNLSLTERGCDTCKEEVVKIVDSIDKRKKVVIILDPAFNICNRFESYHISCKEI